MSAGLPTIYNLTLTNALTEYSQVLNVSFSASFTVQSRQITNEVRMYFVAGATTYITLLPGATYTFNIQQAGIRTIFFQSPQAGTIVEILEWQ